MRVARAPGRVNLMGDHTDHTGGLVLPMACDLATEVRGVVGGERVVLSTDWAGATAVADLPLAIEDLRSVEPAWVRLVAAVVAEVRPTAGFSGAITSTVPTGAGLSSSAALCASVALALGFRGAPLELARLARRAEQAATGVPCGVMDQLASAAGVAGHVLRIDCTSLSVEAIPLPAEVEVLVVHSGIDRSLDATPYAAIVADLRAAEAVVGPLPAASLDGLAALADRQQRARVRHVVTENARVDELAAALGAGDRRTIAAVLDASHRSLRDDLGVTVPAIDALVDALVPQAGVLGARCTGAGWGGCVVALVEAGARVVVPDGLRSWRLRATAGASVAEW